MSLDVIKNYLSEKKFKKNNRFLFFKNKNKNSEILVEFNAYHPVHIAISYLVNIIAKKNKSKINAFYNYSLLTSPLKNTILNELKWKVGNFFSLKNFGIYRSFGVKKILNPHYPQKMKGCQRNILKKFTQK